MLCQMNRIKHGLGVKSTLEHVLGAKEQSFFSLWLIISACLLNKVTTAARHLISTGLIPVTMLLELGLSLPCSVTNVCNET